METNYKQFLITEYQQLSAFVSNAWTISYTVLTGGVIAYGFLISQIQLHRDEEVFAAMLTLVPTVLALILGQLTSAVYFFFFRMLEIASEFDVRDRSEERRVGNGSDIRG